MSNSACEAVMDDMAALADGDREAIAKHAEHLAGCDACRDARHEATEMGRRIAEAGADYRAGDVEQMIARVYEENRKQETGNRQPATADAASTLVGMGAAQIE